MRSSLKIAMQNASRRQTAAHCFGRKHAVPRFVGPRVGLGRKAGWPSDGMSVRRLLVPLLAAILTGCGDKVARQSDVLQVLGIPTPLDFSTQPCADEWKHREPDKMFDTHGYCRFDDIGAGVFLNWDTGQPLSGERMVFISDSAQWARFRDSTTAAMQTIATLTRCRPRGGPESPIRYAQKWTLRSSVRSVRIDGLWSRTTTPNEVTGQQAPPGMIWIVVPQTGPVDCDPL